ncbi:MAG: alpha/beta hydrolase [Burkholderiaceae bacterium]|nr:alpha/beta hydrolase [Burkholderiaceae bacterium]
MYLPRRPCTSTFLSVRELNTHLRSWGEARPGQRPLVLLHGWMDVGASYQFVVDAFSDAFVAGRQILAPDWRGFGLSHPPRPCDHYVFADYLADLDQLLDHLSPDQPVDLVGHSMGGNVAMMYAGVRPQRVHRLVNLEGFGLPATRPEQAPARYARWMDEIKQLQQGAMALKAYDSVEGVAQRLVKTNPRLAPDKALWLARHWAQPDAQGQWKILGDAAHKVTSAQLFRADELRALYAAITAPTLAVVASDDSLGQWWKGQYTLEDFQERLAQVRDVRTAQVPETGHMLHHDQPEAVAGLIEAFISAA